MKILLDENIDVRLKSQFPLEGFQVLTVSEMKWNGIKNGQLLRLLGEHNFDFWIVADKNIPYQQNTKQLPCCIIVLDTHRNTLKHIRSLMPRVLDLLSEQRENCVRVISERP